MLKQDGSADGDKQTTPAAPSLSKTKSELVRMEEADDFVIPPKYAMAMTMFSMASGGKKTITVDQLARLAQMPLMMMSGQIQKQKQMVSAMLKAMSGGKIPDDAIQAIVGVIDNVQKEITSNLDKLIEPIFSVVDVNDSGTISKKEFFHIARIAMILKDQKGNGGPPSPAVQKELLDAVYDLIDINQDGEISKMEIAKYVRRIFEAIGRTINVIISFVINSLDDDLWDLIGKTGFSFLPMLQATGVDLLDDEGNISYTKVAPYLAMADPMLKGVVAKAQQADGDAVMQAQIKQSIKSYMDMEENLIKAMKDQTDEDGYITKDSYVKIVMNMMSEMVDKVKSQVPMMISQVPPQMQQIVMMISGFIDPATILSNVFASRPFVYQPMIDVVFDEFGTKGKIHVKTISTVYNLLAGTIDPRVDNQTADPNNRLKALFDIFDLDGDGTITSKEAGKILGGGAKISISAIACAINFYLRVISEPTLVTGGLSAAEAIAAQKPPPSTGLSPPKFPLKKKYFEGIIAYWAAKKGGDPLDKNAKLKKLFEYCDADGDGMLTLAEFNRIEADRMGSVQFQMVCQLFDSGDKMTFAAFKLQYENGMDVDADLSKISA